MHYTKRRWSHSYSKKCLRTFFVEFAVLYSSSFPNLYISSSENDYPLIAVIWFCYYYWPAVKLLASMMKDVYINPSGSLSRRPNMYHHTSPERIKVANITPAVEWALLGNKPNHCLMIYAAQSTKHKESICFISFAFELSRIHVYNAGGRAATNGATCWFVLHTSSGCRLSFLI